MIPFNKPPLTGNEIQYVQEAMASSKISGDGQFGRRCHQWFESTLPCKKALLTPSCTHALEMAAILIDIGPGDEVIMPSYTFVSTANAFALRGATIVFVDIRPDTLNIDESLIEAAVTERTKAIVPVHYAGVGCEMETIMAIADRYGLFVIEDAAQGMMATYNGRALGTIGHLGTFSFHETKNYTSGGEGGLLIINDERFIERAEIIREKGTNRSRFFRGEVDKYSWVDIGSSYLQCELQSAYLYAQLLDAEKIYDARMQTWHFYYDHLKPLKEKGLLELPSIPEGCLHNAHMFYVKFTDPEIRCSFLDYMKASEILAVFHYVPLHSSLAGVKFGRFHGLDRHTTALSERVARLPVFYNLDDSDRSYIVRKVIDFFAND